MAREPICQKTRARNWLRDSTKNICMTSEDDTDGYGPVVALLDRADQFHSRSIEALRRLPAEPLLTTWVCFTEAMYLLGEVGGYYFQSTLWNMQLDGRLVLHELTAREIGRMALLMNQYQDIPMDMADASLVATAESLSEHRILTFDTDFYIYRLIDGSALEIIG